MEAQEGGSGLVDCVLQFFLCGGGGWEIADAFCY